MPDNIGFRIKLYNKITGKNGANVVEKLKIKNYLSDDVKMILDYDLET